MKKYKLLKKFQQLSLLSFVAACSGKSAEGSYFFGKGFDSKGEQKPPDQQPEPPSKTPLSFEAAALSEADSGYSVTEDGGTTSLTVEIKDTQGTPAILAFPDGAQTVRNTGATTTGIYKLTLTDNQYDLVVSVPSINKGSGSGDYNKGSIFIFWNMADIKGETIGGTSTTSINKRLEIKGAYGGDFIGIHAPDFLQIAGKTDEQKYDMVIRSQWVSNTKKGAIYILWDVTDYIGATNVIDLGDHSATITYGSLAIFGNKPDDYIGTHGSDFLEIDGNTKLDMVIRSHEVDFAGNGTTTNNTNEGAIYILRDVASYYSTDNTKRYKIIDLGKLGETDNGATAGSLVIFGDQPNDSIGIHAPEFLEIDGNTKLDMVIRSHEVDFAGNGSATNNTNEGAIYILWDVADYTGNKTIYLDDPADDTFAATAGLLRIFGEQDDDYIGTHATEFLQIGGVAGVNKMDMVIQSEWVEKGNERAETNEGAIYILWDVEDYFRAGTAPPIHLGDESTITHGSLVIFGDQPNDSIGIHAPEFLEIDDNTKLDMVIRSHEVDFAGNGSATNNTNEGAIYILWDIASYYSTDDAKRNKAIHLGNNANVSPSGDNSFAATAGLVAIFGKESNDYIGTHAPEFLQIGGVAGANKLDMVIKSEWVDKGSEPTETNEGAIYILWDVESYVKAGAVIPINLSNSVGYTQATSGLLTIYGAATDAKLGSDANNVLYDTDTAGNKILTNIDGDSVGTKDIVFQDSSYTYVLFGDKVAEVDGATQKVASKTIDLGQINADGYFDYDFGSGNVDDVGYRFADRKSLADVKNDLPDDGSNPLSSESHVDFSAWDIA